MRILRLTPFAALLAVPVLAWADSGVGVDTWLANKLDPTGGNATETIDPNGTSWLEPGEHRTPTGSLYPSPAQTPNPGNLYAWQIFGTFDFGFLNTSGSKTALFDRYTRWPTDGSAFDADLHLERPSDGSYAEIRGSHISAEDQYYLAVYGKAGAYKAEVFVRDMPNVLSTDSKSIWNGAGTNNLTLKDGLVPGASTPAQVAAVSAAQPNIALGTERRKEGLSLSSYLSRRWTTYLNVSNEDRKGDRPYGGPFFFDFDNLGGAILETIKPIDDRTININAGLRYTGSTWRFDFGYSGSIYRDHYLSYNFQQPFELGPSLVPGTVASTLTQGQMSMEPDNDYNNLRITATRVLPMNGQLSLTASEGDMRQNDNLIPPTNCQGTFGYSSNGTFTLGPQNPQLFPCSQWNTTGALSQQTANMLIVSTLAQGTLVLQPLQDLSVRFGAKYDREDYRNQYLSYNPENGYYGYVATNGGQGSIVPGPGFWNPVTYPDTSDVQVESIPYSWLTSEVYGGADWKFSQHETVGMTYTFDHYSPDHREVSYANDNTVKFNWTDKTFSWVTFRFNYTHLNQSGSVYDSDPYAFAFFYNLPGFLPADDTPTAWTVNAQRKYDISDRTESKIDVMATVTPRPDMTVTASVRGDWNRYPTVIGRQGYDTSAAVLQWEWQPEELTNMSVWTALDHSRMHMTNVNDTGAPLAVDTPDDTLGGPTYPLANTWSVADEERNWSAGAILSHYFGATRLDLTWNYESSRGVTSYSYSSPAAMTFPYTAAEAGTQFPAMTYDLNSFTLSYTIPLSKQVSLRLFDYYEHGQVSDWHYAGFANSLVYGNRVYTDAGPQGYNTNVAGLFVNVKL